MEESTPPEVATQRSWRCWPPGPMEPIPYRAFFSAAEYATIQRGLVPEQMEDKWFIFWDRDVLYMHRSWTGHCVYRVVFQAQRDAYEVHEAYVSTDETKYRRGPVEYEVRLVEFLIRALLLEEVVPFPFPPWIKRTGSHGQYRHLVAGNVRTADRMAEEAGLLARVYRRLRRWLTWGS